MARRAWGRRGGRLIQAFEDEGGCSPGQGWCLQRHRGVRDVEGLSGNCIPIKYHRALTTKNLENICQMSLWMNELSLYQRKSCHQKIKLRLRVALRNPLSVTLVPESPPLLTESRTKTTHPSVSVTASRQPKRSVRRTRMLVRCCTQWHRRYLSSVESGRNCHFL